MRDDDFADLHEQRLLSAELAKAALENRRLRAEAARLREIAELEDWFNRNSSGFDRS